MSRITKTAFRATIRKTHMFASDCNSACITHIEVWGNTNEVDLILTFVGNRVYGYTVPMNIAEQLVTAFSIGKAYNALIRGQFDSVRI